MRAAPRLTVLAVGFEAIPQTPPHVETFFAESAAETIATLRLVSCDLLVVGAYRSDLDVWMLMSRIHAGWSHQRWVYVDPKLSARDEIQARSLGALMILDRPPSRELFAELSRTLLPRRRRDVRAIDDAAATATGALV